MLNGLSARNSVLAAAIAGALLAVAPAHAALIAGPDIIAAPSQVLNAGVTNVHQQGFDEQQNVLLAAPLAVDGGSIAAGTRVSSHMIFLNLPATAGSTSDIQTWAFDGIVLGVMSDNDGTLELASNALLGAPGTTYPAAAFNNRGLEAGSADGYTFVANSISVNMNVTQPGDWIRVVTAAVPVPATPALLALGLGLVGISRGRRTAKLAS